MTLFEAALGALEPYVLTAKTTNVYDVPFANPVTVTGEADPVPVIELGVEVAVYPVIALAPGFEGAVKVTDAVVLPPVAVPIVGASGTFSGAYDAVNIPA